MLIVLVYVHVKAEAIEAFKEISRENARNSLQEPGVARFDVMQQADDATRFVLAEVYRDAEAAASHKETSHYLTWRSQAVDLIAEPRYSIRYDGIYPPAGE